MRTLALLTALLLLVLQTQAEPLLARGEEAPDQVHVGDEDQDMAISFGGDKTTALQDADVKSGLTCYCRRGSCGFLERLYGACSYRGYIFRLCCR
ncbi:neutrophil antibiotic peptide NP-1-like [Acomys russatus]|uniref:neutrophil antibiotic peptide NP-1-like n=1 Tax=Acomys russatus TaxID=60746 RepID=UPI0021E2FAC5|nr:neutrophil antibiotic peptide NP-1-like [Acomys russatus]